ncbi:MAG: signal peptidase II [bacterium]
MTEHSRGIHLWVAGIFSSVLILDQVTKYLVRSFMHPCVNVSVIPGFFDLVYVMNRGGAFGMLSTLPSCLRVIIFIGFSLIAIAALVVVYWKSHSAPSLRIAIAFLLAGAIGNLVDRLQWGMVVDFLDFYVGRYHWPAFNVADSAICIGLGLVILNLFVTRDEKTAIGK